MAVVLFVKANCPLCEEAREVLRRLGLAFEERDILADAALFARYRYRIPVLAVDGAEVQEGHMDPGAVRRLAKSRSRGDPGR